MASIHRDTASNTYRIMFRYGGRQYRKSLKTADEAEAQALKGRVELVLLERGRRALPADADLWEYLRSDGQRARKTEAAAAFTLDMLFTRYEQAMPPGKMEPNSLDTFRLHRNHLLRILGARTNARTLGTSEFQGYVNKRAREKYRGGLIKSRTIKKEIGALRAVWNWDRPQARHRGEPHQGPPVRKGGRAHSVPALDGNRPSRRPRRHERGRGRRATGGPVHEHRAGQRW